MIHTAQTKAMLATRRATCVGMHFQLMFLQPTQSFMNLNLNPPLNQASSSLFTHDLHRQVASTMTRLTYGHHAYPFQLSKLALHKSFCGVFG
jgi:hypothetical protein